ncbi:MAG: GntP family permease, partial [Verrucomicrobiae bacterium]|nr:GntP family permease [Verrucomicrobiae bacterium]
CGGVVTHSLCAPHPGPLAMAETLKLDLGVTILAGITAGVIPTYVSYCAAKWLNRRYQVPMRDAAGTSVSELKRIIEQDERQLPSFAWSIAPVLVPILLMSIASFCDAIAKNRGSFQWFIGVMGGSTAFDRLLHAFEFLGNRNIALLIGAVVAIGVLMRQKNLSVAQVCHRIGPSFETAGVIILITSAGGAFGLMLKNAGVGEAIKALVAGKEVNLVVLAWAVAAVIRVAQGSATVAMLTTAAMIYPIISTGPPLSYHPIYIFMAIGFGAMILSWMNDSGFWVVGRLSGFTEQETLKSWTIVVTVNSLVGLLECVILSRLLPFSS